MRIGIAGLNALYWPVAAGNVLVKKEVEFLAAATLGESEQVIKASLGLSLHEYAERYHVKLYNQPEEMIQSEHLDTVILISRHSQHADFVERLAKLGVNIYIPKTFTTTLEDADRIVAAEQRYGVRIAVGPSARFLPQIAAVKKAVEEGLIGEPFSVRICHHHGTIDVFNPQDWYRDAQEGGPELSLAWYGIDLALQLLKDRVKSIYAQYGNFTSPDSPFMDCGRISLQMQNGASAAFDMYFCNRVPYPSWQVEVIGTRGVVSIHRVQNDPGKTVVSLDSADGYRILPVPEDTPHWEMFWVDELAHNLPLSIDASYAREVTRLSIAALQSSRTGKAVEVS